MSSKLRAEWRERESKKRNIVVHNLMEADPAIKSGDDRSKADNLLLTKVLEEMECSVHPVTDIKFFFRLGSKSEKENKPRPLLVGLTTTEKKTFILDKVYSSNRTPSEYISVVPDLTKLQRQEEEELRAEAMDKNYKMPPEDFFIWEWRVRGLKGEKVLVKVRRKPDERVPVFRPEKTTKSGKIGSATLGQHQEESCGGTGGGGGEVTVSQPGKTSKTQ